FAGPQVPRGPWAKVVMQVGDTQVKIRTRPGGPSAPSRSSERWPAGGARLLEAHVLEAWLLNVDASLRVHSRPQLFGWAQGLLQNLLPHELVLCAVREDRALAYQVDCFASPWIDAEKIRALFQQDVELVAGLLRRWVEAGFHPVVCSMRG